ncbi:MAG: hypothetical protein MJA83_02930 [Gammaproteobacteria bacterium]|nr:hypothetical protein [Gammaproteobacteria bacterium]
MTITTKPRFLRLILIAACCIALPALAEDQWIVTAADWSRPRSGEMVLQLEGIHNAVNAWRDDSGADIIIIYAGGESGGFWAEEIRSWMIALGIPGEHVITRTGGLNEDRIVLQLER